MKLSENNIRISPLHKVINLLNIAVQAYDQICDIAESGCGGIEINGEMIDPFDLGEYLKSELIRCENDFTFKGILNNIGDTLK